MQEANNACNMGKLQKVTGPCAALLLARSPKNAKGAV